MMDGMDYTRAVMHSFAAAAAIAIVVLVFNVLSHQGL